MPRPKKPGGPEPKKRSRNGCWPCKSRKVKCGEERPKCLNCERQGETCDYSIRLNWDGRAKRKGETVTPEPYGSPSRSRTLGKRPLSFDSSSSMDLVGKDNAIKLERPPSSSLRVSNERTAPFQQPMPDQGHALTGNINHYPKSPVSRWESEEPQMSHKIRPETSAIDPALMGLNDPGYMANDTMSPPDSASNKSVSDRYNAIENIRDQVSASQLSRFRERTHSPYPSPADSGMSIQGSSAGINSPSVGHQHSMQHARMLPPFQSTVGLPHPSFNQSREQEATGTADHRSKRQRLDPFFDFEMPTKWQKIQFHSSMSSLYRQNTQQRSPNTIPHQPKSPLPFSVGVPLTPAASANSDDAPNRYSSKSSPPVLQDSPDQRRLSVKSLLSADEDLDEGTTPTSNQDLTTQKTYYGLDRGIPDLDQPKNNDMEALSFNIEPSINAFSTNDAYESSNLRFDNGQLSGHAKGSYYDRLVSVTIPKSLEPLPTILRKNPMNLLYFHHFLNHTARILVIHDCSENPFKSILPQMAVGDINLLHLMLAYSASHRARLLNHPEPSNRIAVWVRDVFPALRLALDGPSNAITNANLATAIMLASLEIISPNTFEVPISWQNHLGIARSMILARGGAESVHRKDKISYFLMRWFAYLDVLGSLSGSKNDQPLFSGHYWANDNEFDDENEFEIDCLLGFTSRCVSILARVAELARQCDNERIDGEGRIRPHWTPSHQTIRAAQQIKRDLQDARTHRYNGCPHRRTSVVDEPIYHHHDEAQWDAEEMVATNDAFHWAGLVQLDRRVLGKPAMDAEVQYAVREIIGALDKVKEGGTAEANLVFPIFTAGCDARERAQRERIMERLRNVERSGMTQVNKARSLMEKVWETGRPWETLVTAEFIG